MDHLWPSCPVLWGPFLEAVLNLGVFGTRLTARQIVNIGPATNGLSLFTP